MIDFTADWADTSEPLPHFWEHTVGSCHAPLALRGDWQAQLRRCHDELGFRHVRFHGLLCDDMSTLVRYRDQLVYSFFNADRIVDTLRELGMRPFVELGFMPRAIASGDKTVFHYAGNITPPRDPGAWETLVDRLIRHWVERYGLDEVRQWYFEVWNEPNLKDFWAGTQADYWELYRHATRAIKRVDPQLRVGGPATAKEEWIDEFRAFAARAGVPIDFISTHHYPNDVLWYENQDTETQLANGKRGILREWTLEARRKAGSLPLYYTEWGCSSNPRYPPQDEPYAAAFIIKTIMEANGLVDGYSYWTFSDIFEENHFPSTPFHGGFGLLTIHGVPKPAYRAFEILHQLGTERLAVRGRHETVDAWLVRGPGRATLLLTNHQLPRRPVRTERARCTIAGLPPVRSACVERIDDDHANPKRAWQEMGLPEYLRADDVARLHQASRLVREEVSWRADGAALIVDLDIPPQAVAAVTLELE